MVKKTECVYYSEKNWYYTYAPKKYSRILAVDEVMPTTKEEIQKIFELFI
jgi:hypothetical protein